MKVYTILRQYKESDILVTACDNYQYALDTYNKEIDKINRKIYSNAIGIILSAWEKGKPILLQKTEFAVGG